MIKQIFAGLIDFQSDSNLVKLKFLKVTRCLGYAVVFAGFSKLVEHW